VNKVTWKGTEFRTLGSQTLIQTDNSCILSSYNQQEDKNERAKLKIAIGRITDLYVHTLHGKEGQPGHKWSVFIKADWYEPVGVNQVNGLLQVRQNPNWDRCGIANMLQCHASNCCFWPSDPLSLMEAKKPKKSSSRQKKKQKVDKVDILYDVITHHDDEQALMNLEEFFESDLDSE
jgi:hypothetical protein